MNVAQYTLYPAQGFSNIFDCAILFSKRSESATHWLPNKIIQFEYSYDKNIRVSSKIIPIWKAATQIQNKFHSQNKKKARDIQFISWMRSYIPLHQILLGWSNQGEWDGLDM
jgi:hypothetical protein